MLKKYRLMPNNFVFFGTDEFAAAVLQGLGRCALFPTLIITTPDRPKGRGLKLTPPPAKVWAEKNAIPYSYNLSPNPYNLFIVASYGQIIPKNILDMPTHGTLNLHPSLLPKYRGPTPIQSAILNGDEETGVSIILLDEEIDHGPVLATKTYNLKPITYPLLRDELAKLGAELLAEVLPDYLAGKIKPVPQDHAIATFTKKIKKEDGLIDPAGDSQLNYREFLAYQPWPGVYFFENGKRIKITNAHLDGKRFVIDTVVPEGGKEILWKSDFHII